ncbi:MAG: glycosyltransferase [Rhizobiaceae bacterium]|nr:glycosyltransferase [Rhizobiaceae bacterium]
MSDRPSISVVITAHNAAATIGDCLRSIAAQPEAAQGRLEIVLVDDRSTDGTAEAAVATGVPGLNLIRIDRPAGNRLTTRQHALAIGFAAARGDFVLTADADGHAAPDWAAAMTAPIASREADAVAGPVFFRAASGWLGVWQTVDVSYYLLVCKLLNRLGFAAGVLFGNFAFRREWFGRVGGFERIGMTLTEDLAFARALHGAGARLAYRGRGAVEVEACASWSVLIERAKRVSAGGTSALAFALGGWMLSFVALLAAALVLGGGFATAFGIRYALGAAFTAVALLRVRRWNLLPLALLYEPLAIVIGVLVMLRIARDGKVEWGGVRYER